MTLSYELRVWISEHPLLLLVSIAAILATITVILGGWL